MPAGSAAAGGSSVMSRPSSRMRRDRAAASPVMRLNRVDLAGAVRADDAERFALARPRAIKSSITAPTRRASERFRDAVVQHRASVQPGEARRLARPSLSAQDRLHLAASRNFRRGLLSTTTMSYLPSSPAAIGRRPAASWRCSCRERRHVVGAESDRADDRCRAWWRRSPSQLRAVRVGSWARFSTSTATSNSAWTKPIGCVHCLPDACS